MFKKDKRLTQFQNEVKERLNLDVEGQLLNFSERISKEIIVDKTVTMSFDEEKDEFTATVDNVHHSVLFEQKINDELENNSVFIRRYIEFTDGLKIYIYLYR